MIKYIIALLIVLMTFSCAQNIGDVDRTKSGRVDKALFNSSDVWYMRNTIIDVPFSTGFSFVGNQGETELIRWRITEDYLYAHRAFDWIDGTEEEYIQEGGIYFGAPVAIYRIKSHFDVQRQYNPSTGEETNVIVENMSDRPWNERNYMRVDWSKNLVKDMRYGSISKIPTAPISYYVPETEVDNPERLVLSKDYISLVGMIFSEPETFTWGGHKYPYCYLYSDQHTDCLGQRIKYRTSFLKRDTTNVYKGVQYDDNKFNKFGFFRTDRFKYDKYKGTNRENEIHLINKWNLCKKDSEDQNIATCEKRKIVYYLNEGFPEDLKDEAKKIALSWNRVLKATVQIAKGNNVDYHKEVLTNLDDYFDNHDLQNDIEGEDLFILCPNNPVQEGDPAECLPAGEKWGKFSPQIGDLRYSMIYWIAAPQKSSPLGYGPAANDTETGEIFQANAFIYGNALETYITYIMDIMDLLNGDTSLEDYTSGDYLNDYLASKDYSVAPERSLGHKIDLKGVTARYNGISNYLNNSDFTSLTSASDKLNKLRGTQLENMLLTNDFKKQLTNGNDSANLANISLVDLISPEKYKKMEEFRNKLAKNTVMLSNFKDTTMISWAMKLKAKYCTTGECTPENRAAIALDVKKHMFFSVALHEVGHTMGLRHNYHSSSDAINFFDQYWDLKATDASHKDGKFAPEYINKPSNDVLEAGLRESQYTSIMDYLMRPNSSLKGLGVYDYAAIHYGYGNQVMVFDGDGYNKDFYKDVRGGNYHYTSLPYLLKTVNGCNGEDTTNCSQTTDEVLSNLRARKWTQLKNEGPGKACGVDIACETGVCNRFGHCVECLENSDCTTGFCSDTGQCLDNVEVPVAFCSDETVGTDWRCYRFSEGADFYEKAKGQSDLFQSYYFMRNFKRGKALFGMNFYGYLSRVARTFLEMDNMLKYSAYESYIKRNDVNFVEKSGLGQHFVIGQKVIMNFFAAIMQTARPGVYKPSELGDPNLYELDEPIVDYKHFNTDGLGIKNILIKPGKTAKYESSYYDPSLGYYYYYKPIIQGVWIDKVLALIYMSDPLFVPVGNSFSGVLKKYAVSLNTLFPSEYQKIVASMYAENPKDYAPYFPVGDDGKIKVDEDGNKIINYRPAVFYSDAEKTAFENSEKIFIDPLTQYTVRLYAGYSIPTFLNTTWLTSSLYDSGRIGVKGSPDDYEPDWDNLVVYDGTNYDEADYTEVTDPKTRRTYYAMKFNSYKQIGGVDYNLGWTLIEQTKAKAIQVEAGDIQSYEISGAFDKMDVMRAFYHHYK